MRLLAKPTLQAPNSLSYNLRQNVEGAGEENPRYDEKIEKYTQPNAYQRQVNMSSFSYVEGFPK